MMDVPRAEGRDLLRRAMMRYGNILLLVIVAVVMYFLNPRFLSLANIVNLSRQIVPTGFLAIGLMFVIVSGGIDLSAGFGVSLAAVLMGVVYLATGNLWVALLVTLAVGVLMGLANGLLIARLGMYPFIVTLATMSIFQGLTYVFSFGRLAWVRHPFMQFIGGGAIAGIPSAFLILVVFYALSHVVLNWTRLGTYAIAIGGSESSAVLAGINVRRTKLALYVLAGVCTSLCSIVMISRLQMTAPTIGGSALLMDGIAATILGGTSLTGGKASVGGTFVGVIIIILIGNILNLLNIDPNFRDVFKGVIIVAVLFFDRAVNAESYKEPS